MLLGLSTKSRQHLLDANRNRVFCLRGDAVKTMCVHTMELLTELDTASALDFEAKIHAGQTVVLQKYARLSGNIVIVQT